MSQAQQPSGQQQQQQQQQPSGLQHEEQRSVIRVACESSDCGALLEVPIHEDLRRQAPPQLVIRCANCKRLLSVNLPPETYASLPQAGPSIAESPAQAQGLPGAAGASTTMYSPQTQMELIRRQQEQLAMLQMLQQQIAAQQSQLQSLGLMTPGGGGLAIPASGTMNVMPQASTGPSSIGFANMGIMGTMNDPSNLNALSSYRTGSIPKAGASSLPPHGGAAAGMQPQQGYGGELGGNVPSGSGHAQAQFAGIIGSTSPQQQHAGQPLQSGLANLGATQVPPHMQQPHGASSVPEHGSQAAGNLAGTIHHASQLLQAEGTAAPLSGAAIMQQRAAAQQTPLDTNMQSLARFEYGQTQGGTETGYGVHLGTQMNPSGVADVRQEAAATSGGVTSSKPLQQRRRRSADEPEVRKTPSEYHKFLQEECKRLKSSNPEMPAEERLITAARKVSPGDDDGKGTPRGAVGVEQHGKGGEGNIIGGGESQGMVGEVGTKSTILARASTELQTPVVAAVIPRGGDFSATPQDPLRPSDTHEGAVEEEKS